jgi:hypothetical protein
MSNKNPRMIAGDTPTISKMFGIAVGTLQNLRSQGRGPRYYRLGRKILYKIDDVSAWVFSNPQMTLDSHEDLNK